MKRILAALLIVGCAASIACADWLDNFKGTYRNKNLGAAVEGALKEGVAPDIIVKNALAFENINPQNIVTSLYCAGLPGKEVYEASEKSDISEDVVTAGFKKSLEECADKVVDSQPYTPGQRGPGRGFGPPLTPPGRPFNVSPSQFN